MPAITENYSLGQPVEIGKIHQELKKLWQERENAMTRASLINLALYSEKPGSLERNTQLIARITENHACRALVIGANRKSKENRVEAWLNAHCHVTRARGKQICSEQLSFSLEGPCVKLLPSVVFSHLDSDLPLYLWWQDDFPDPMDPQLWAWVNRLIFDSQTWKDFGAQMHLVETAQEESHHHFSKIENLKIDYGSGFKSTALLLLGWLGAQLNWKVNEPARNGSCRFVDVNNHKIDIELRQREAGPIGEVTINSSGVQFRVIPAQCGDLLEISRSGENETALPQMMPAQSNDPVDLMTQELLRGGPHRVYLRAVNCVRELL